MEATRFTLVLTLALVAGCADGLGGWLCLVCGSTVRRKQRLYATAAAAGFMLGVVLLDRIPDLYRDPQADGFGSWVLSGFLCVYLLECIVHTHHRPPIEPGVTIVGSLAAQGGLLLHTFFDGVAIGAGFSSSTHSGWLMFFAVIFHKVPEGFSLASLVLAAGRGATAALTSSIGLGISTVIGAMSAVMVSGLSATAPALLLAIATGSFLYVTMCDMLPSVNRERDRSAFAFVSLGVSLYAVSAWLLNSLIN